MKCLRSIEAMQYKKRSCSFCDEKKYIQEFLAVVFTQRFLSPHLVQYNVSGCNVYFEDMQIKSLDK